MLPPILAHQIQDGLADFLRSTFPASNPVFARMLERFLAEKGALFKGPYHSLKLPFRPGSTGTKIFKGFTLPFPPYLHQQTAFERLRGDKARSTLVATGTGSGKTECFLYPILEHCLERPVKGIKAIIIYPMNALATDQAKRLAALIQDKAPNKITAGLYIGGESDVSPVMTGHSLITDRHALRDNPPDILLTNYKMLDYLLLRQEDLKLWDDNDPETLRYLVVDELHTFDGAQGTDLACLIRRLKSRLHTPAQHLVCVGTSATLGAESGAPALADYATRIFGETFTHDSVITETLLTEAEFLDNSLISFTRVPGPADRTALSLENFSSPTLYLKAQYSLWFEEEAPDEVDDSAWRIRLGRQLKEHSFFRNLLTITRRGLMVEEALNHELFRGLKSLRDAPEDLRHLVVTSILSLIAHSRGPDGRLPLLQLRTQLWLRELARLVASVSNQPNLRASDDLKEEESKRHLPVLHCRDCGAMGWGGTMRANGQCLETGLEEFYRSFFHPDSKLRFFMPSAPGYREIEGEQLELSEVICGVCLYAGKGNPENACPRCQTSGSLLPGRVINPSRVVAGQLETDRCCPSCDSETGLTIMGSRAASLTSVALGQTFASPFNDHKKALAFSDAVQDASHRAGFFSARTWKMNLRTAMQKVLQSEPNPVPLSALAYLFATQWRKPYGDAHFAGVFSPPHIEWKDDFEHLEKHGKLPEGSKFAEQVMRRVSWELTSEFGHNSRVGRTLEKSGSAIIAPESSALTEALAQALPELQEKIGTLRDLTALDLRRLTLGLLARFRTKGGIFHSELDGYVASAGNTYGLHKTHDHLPSFFRSAPVYFVTPEGGGSRFERLWASGTARTWPQRWLDKCLPGGKPQASELARDILPVLLKHLTKSGLIEKREALGAPVWGLNPVSWLVHGEVHQLSCAHCGHGFSCAGFEVEDWRGMPCQRLSCGGTYVPTHSGPDYYGRLYASGDVERIRAREHTGLLERGEREELERRFQLSGDNRRTTDPNLLSCTPTLEMGINIGDLSTLFLCSVPPGQANYLQRIGRAGRRDGNAFNLTVADARSHGLYYFEEPLLMMTGDVPLPGVFLNAPAVLERQFTAFGFDHWIATRPGKSAVPRKLDQVLNHMERAPDPNSFPYNLLRHIESNLDLLLESFFGIFRDEDLSVEAKESLRVFAQGDAKTEGSLIWKITNRLDALLCERKDLRERLKALQNAISKNKSLPARDEQLEEELKLMLMEKEGFLELLKNLNHRETLQVFTDEGLLPNYAFPEEGVTLHSVILRRKAVPDEHGAYTTRRFDYERPAAVALTELAPGNTFYAGGRKLTIDQVSIGLSQREMWHFCDNCSHIERDESESRLLSSCPRCQSPNWSDQSLIRPMLRMRQVTTTMTDRESRIHDDTEERDPHFFNKHFSADIEPVHIEKSYQLNDAAFPFGFEFIRKATFREVNLGQPDATAETMKLGGKEHQGRGFRLCPKCGKVQKRKGHTGMARQHDLACPLRDQDDTESLDAVFLYRELTSEALRILIPTAGEDSDSGMASFHAAVYVGLREHFKGNIDHLESCAQVIPLPEAPSLRRRYLVLYDSVPGGTGYLKELMRSPNELLEVLRKGRKAITNCPCEKDPEKDGCHRCVRAYRLRRDHAIISRQKALALLNALLTDEAKLSEISGGLSAIDINPLVKSELEQRFLQSLRSRGGFKLDVRAVRGHTGYLLTHEGTNAAWEIAPQVDADKQIGVTIPSRPDFVFYPLRGPDASFKSIKPIAVFLDGFTFHADSAGGFNRIGEDLGKRMALLHQAKWRVWSLTWNDVHPRQDELHFKDYGDKEATLRSVQFAKMVPPDRLEKCGLGGPKALSSLDLLFLWLRRPDEEVWLNQAFHLGLFFGGKQFISRTKVEEVAENILKDDPKTPLPSASNTGDTITSSDLVLAEDGHTPRLRSLFWISATQLATKNLAAPRHLLWFNDTSENTPPPDQSEWCGLLRLTNLLQFLPGFHAVSPNGLAGGWLPNVLDALRESPTSPTPSQQPSPVWEELRGLSSRKVHAFLDVLRASQLPPPEAGFELFGEGGTILAGAELAWVHKQVAILLEDSMGEKSAFAGQGWQVLVLSTSTPEALLATLRNSLA